jgi:hypothetical protein
MENIRPRRTVKRWLLTIAMYLVFAIVMAYISLYTDYWPWLFAGYRQIGPAMVAAWHWAASHKEPIVNLADLFSFFFVTPEIAARFSSSARVQRIAGAIVVLYFFGIFLGVTIWATYAFYQMIYQTTPMWRLVGSFITLPVGFLATLLFGFMSYKAISGKDPTFQAMSGRDVQRIMLAIGVLLFVASRLFAITAAIAAG